MQEIESTSARRRFRRALAALALSAAAAWQLAACASSETTPGGPGGASPCAAGLTACGAACVDLETDAAHCGDCEAACEVGPCQAGACTTGCAAGLKACDGTCVDVSSDPAHCGGCDVACEGLDTCVEATCACDETVAECGPGCTSDLDCDDDEHCQGGRCQLLCGPGELFCDQTCIDGTSDDQNCGACDFTCATGESCESSSCECGPGVCGSCGVTDLGGASPQTVSGTSAGGVDALEPSCSPASTREVVYSFTPDVTATYTFAVSAGFATTLYLLDDACAETHCSDIGSQGADPELTANLVAGETTYVVVDGFQDEGPFTLSVSDAPLVPCPGAALGDPPQTVTGDNTGGADLFMGSCAFLPGGAEATFSFTAQSDGEYLFDATGSAFPVVIYVLDSACGGTELACNSDFLAPKVLVDLAAGQTVTVVVDASGPTGVGAYTLQVTATNCPGATIGALPATVTDDLANYTDVFTPSCLFFSGADALYGFTAPTAGKYAFDTFGSTVDTDLYALSGSCNGQELACNTEIAGNAAQVVVDMAAGATIVVGVDGVDPGAFTLNARKVICPDQVFGFPPQTLTGTTTQGVHQHEPLCAAAGGPEVTHLFTAPAAGNYTFDTTGSSIDTKLYVRDGGCDGAELGCADVFGGTEQLTVQLGAFQEVIVFVDSAGFTAGDYALSVSGP
jgi:hypothetical protein